MVNGIITLTLIEKKNVLNFAATNVSISLLILVQYHFLPAYFAKRFVGTHLHQNYSDFKENNSIDSIFLKDGTEPNTASLCWSKSYTYIFGGFKSEIQMFWHFYKSH